MSPRLAIIVAGGQGLRMGAELPKQFIPLCGRPILMHTLERFMKMDLLVLVLPKGHISYWQNLCDEYNFRLPHRVVEGGETRFHSVQAALAVLDEYEDGLVAIHDGVRPLVSLDVIERVYCAAAESGAALPTVEVVDSLRRIEASGHTRAVVRSEYLSVQTPQAFALERLRRAYALPYDTAFTDDASVYEAAKQGELQLIDGNIENIKITSPKDLILAEYYLSQQG